MARWVLLTLLMFLNTSSAWCAVLLMGSNGRDWNVGQYVDDHDGKIQCLMRWDSAGRTFTYALFKDGAVMSFKRDAWNLPETMDETSITIGGKSVTVHRLDEHTLGLGWGDDPSPLPTLLFNAFIQSGQETTVGFAIDESPWFISFPASVSITDAWLKCVSNLDKN